MIRANIFQETITILDKLHIGKGGVHSALSKFEKGWHFPKKGCIGKQIVEKFGSEKVVEGLGRLYSQPKWKFSLKKFEQAVKFTQAKPN